MSPSRSVRRTVRRALRTPTLLGLALLLAIPLSAPATDGPPPLDFDQLFARGAGGRQIRQPTWSPNGERLVYLWNDGTDPLALWVQQVPDGERRQLVSVDDLGVEARFLESLRFSADGELLVFAAAGDLFAWDFAADALRRLTETDSEEQDAKPSPDGASIAFVRDANLYLLDLADGSERPLTTDGEEDVLLNGVTDWVYWEELWNRDSTGYWWSPEGDRIAFYQFDETPVGTYPLLVELEGAPTVTWQKYPAAGEPLPLVRVGVLDLGSGEIVWMETGEPVDVYLPRVDWRPDGEVLAIQRMNRDQTLLEILFCGPADGSCSVAAEQRSSTWVNLADDFHWLDDGFVWSSEESGWRRLYRYDAEGRQGAAISPEDWAVNGLEAIDEESDEAIYSAFQTFGSGARERHVFRVPLAGGRASKISPEGGWNAAVASPKGRWWVHFWSTAENPTEATLRDGEGRVVGELPFDPPAGIDPQALPSTEILTIAGPDGSRLPAAMIRPRDFDANHEYPVIMYHYGCPASQVVADRWGSRARGLWHRMMADRGYIVLLIDNQASIFFGKEGEDRDHRMMGPTHLAALDATIEYLGGLSYVDRDRIGLWGWSGGGSNTLGAVLNRPGVWRAAVAGAPVTDWHLYDAIWTERYLDRPQDNADGYAASSPLTMADRLQDALMLVHGTGDDNVHPLNTTLMANAFIRAGAPFELAIYPGQKHGLRPPHDRHFYEKMTEFFDRHLAAAAEEEAGTDRPSDLIEFSESSR